VRRLVDALGPGDVSHDGKYLAFFRFHDGAIELAVAARDQSGGRQVAKLQTGAYNSPRWSPDDQQIAFVNPYFGATFEALLLIANASGGTPRAVASELDFQGFTWVPDGTGLIVSSSRGTTMSYPPTYNLWFLELRGGAPVQLTFGESSYEFPDINRTGGFVASRVHEHSDIWKFPVKGEPVDNVLRAVRITTQTGKAQTLTLSPDESEVAFLSDNGGHANVWVARVSDGEMRAITQESDPRVIVGVPYWSPRGDVINFLSNRNSDNSDVTLWLVKPDGSESRDLGIIGVFVCWSKDGSQLYFSDQQKGIWHIAKVSVEGGQPVTVRTDNAIGCSSAPDGTLYYTKLLTQATGAWDFEIRAANPENGASRVLGSIAGSRVPAGAGNFQVYVSPDGRWLGMALKDGSTTNLWALSTTGGGWRKLTDFGTRNVVIARRIAWSKDDKYLYGSVSDVDSDIVRLSGLRW
jgi:Tol biopolymer transport system component